MISVEDDQVELLFSGTRVLIRHSYFQGGVLDVTDCWNDEARTLTLGKEKGQLKLSIVKPKQKGEKASSKDELYIAPVLQRKYRGVRVFLSLNSMGI